MFFRTTKDLSKYLSGLAWIAEYAPEGCTLSDIQEMYNIAGMVHPEYPLQWPEIALDYLVQRMERRGNPPLKGEAITLRESLEHISRLINVHSLKDRQY